ncbi:MAG TPA: PilN domain-containing protein [Rhizomicrobium sp.]
MSDVGLKSRWLGLRALVHAGWQWWREQILAEVPDGIRSVLIPDDPVIAIELRDDAVVIRRIDGGRSSEIAELPRTPLDAAALHDTLAPFLARPWFLRESFALHFPETFALWKTVSLPLAARRNVHDVLDLEIDRQSPLGRDEVYFDYTVIRTDWQTALIEVRWRIARRKAVDETVEICRKAGISLAGIGFAGDEAPADGTTFPIEPRASALLRLRRWLTPGLAMLVVLLAIAVTADAYSRNRQAADMLASTVEQTRVQARGSAQLQRRIADARQQAIFLVRQKQNVMITRLLAEVTRILPKGSWLTELQYRDGEVRVVGLSNSAASLIAAFDASPLFSDAQFRAPLVQSQDGADQFDLSFKLRQRASRV